MFSKQLQNLEYKKINNPYLSSIRKIQNATTRYCYAYMTCVTFTAKL